jgi:hypothetical protein
VRGVRRGERDEGGGVNVQTPTQMAAAFHDQCDRAYERRIRADRQSRAHEVMTSAEEFWNVLRRLDDEDGIEFTRELLEAIREQDETTLALRVAKIAHDDAREAIP